MSDTVKLIIEIPKYAHDYVKDGYWVGDSEIIHNAIQNGILLDDVKAEIEQIIPCDKEALSVKLGVLEIIDNIGKAESEDKG